jgi:MFS family permease
VLGTRLLLGEESFQQWGWRVPFLGSAVLLALSLWIRLKLSESPVFQRMSQARQLARAPVAEAFRGDNLRRILLALVCILFAQGAVWYTAHFYAQFFLERVLKVDGRIVNELLITGVLLSAGAYVFFGWLSDRVGRKPVMLAGMILAVAAYIPAFQSLTAQANPALELAARSAPVRVIADPADCHIQFDLLGRGRFDSSCDVVRRLLSDAGVPYDNVAATPGAVTRVQVGNVAVTSASVEGLDSAAASAIRARLRGEIRSALAVAGYPASAATSQVNTGAVLGVLLMLMFASTALYGPQAAALVELFPARVRYTALSVPYNVGTGWIGGLLPVTSFAIVAATGNIYSGLVYPLAFTAISIVATLIFLPETAGLPLDNEELNDDQARPVRAVG